MDLIMKVRNFIAAWKRQDWATSARLALEILQIITQGLLKPEMHAQPGVASSFMRYEDMTGDELVTELENACNSHGMMAGGVPTEAFIHVILPILGIVVDRIIKKFLGL